MKRLNGRKMILWIMTLVLCVTTCMPAFASVGDRTLYQMETVDGSYSESISGAFKLKDGFCVITGNWDYTIKKFATPQSEPETFVTKNEYENIENISGEEGESETPAVAEDGAEPTGEDAAPEAEADKAETPAATEEKTEAPAAQEGGEKEDDFFADLNWDSPEEGEKTTDAPAESKEEVDTSAAPEAFVSPEDAPAGDDFFADVEWAQEDGESQYYYENDRVNQWFAWNGELYGLVYNENTSEDGSYKITGAAIKHARLENGEIILEDSELPALDMSALMDGQDFYGMESAVTTGNYLIGSFYGTTGNTLAMFDLTDGMYKELPGELDMQSYSAGPDGSLLIMKRSKRTEESNNEVYEVVRLKLDTMEEESFATLKDIYGYRLAMAYDQEKDTLYYVDKGEIWAFQRGTGETVSVNDCPFDAQNALMVDGYMVLWDYRSVLLKNTDPTKRSGTTLRVSNSLYAMDSLSNAVMEMSNKYGDISVILGEAGNPLDSGILQAMMNQDGYNDIYILQFEGKDFRALRDRGYLMEISGNQQIDEYVDRMYPYIGDAMKHDGKLVAIPIYISGNGFGVSMRTWKKLGGTEEELPKTWSQFFDWLIDDVPERIAGTETKVCTYTKEYFYSLTKNNMIYQYQAMLNSRGGEQVFNTPELKNPMKRLDDVDWAVLGISEEEGIGGSWSSDNPPLLDLFQSPVYSTWSNGYKYLELGFEEGEDPVIPVELYVAVINPFSQHQEEAKDFLALTMKNLDIATQYTLFADKTEPVEQANSKDWVNTIAENIASIKEKLETAEGEDKTGLENELDMWEEYREQAEEFRWTISPEAIETYQKRLPYLKVLDYFFIYDIVKPEELQDAEEMYGALFGEGDPEEALSDIDRKINTIRKEGN